MAIRNVSTAVHIAASALTLGACSLLVDTAELSGGSTGVVAPLPDASLAASRDSGIGAADAFAGRADAPVDTPPAEMADAALDGAFDAALDGALVKSDDAGAKGPASCRDPMGAGIATCGPGSNELCCASLGVSGGNFYRSYDAVMNLDKSKPATVSGFGLDRFETTVGRFRRFVNAVVIANWRPAPEAGKHTHLNAGKGIQQGGSSLLEAGWDPAWTPKLSGTQAQWDTRLACGSGPTWTATAGANESLPIACATWFEATAFCIWDGGFLPSEAEWNYAATGGAQQRVYPWSDPPTSLSKNCDRANVFGCGGRPHRAGASALGDGRFGHSDLSGNVFEWVLGYHEDSYASPCVDCEALAPTPQKSMRGGSFSASATQATASARAWDAPDTGFDDVGFRCARVP
jgi:formylglycine-generating enzyme